MWTFLTGANLTMWTLDLDDTSKIAFADNPRLMALKTLHDTLKPTLLFRAGPWLLLDMVVCLLAWRRRNTPAGSLALGVCGSAVVYMMTFSAVGVAPDFRYALWAVLAALAGLIAIAQRRDEVTQPAASRNFQKSPEIAPT
jgi:peptidoglycan/LPS O-acetylase OafA/YrhL